MNIIKNVESLFVYVEQKCLKDAFELVSAQHYFPLLMQYPSVREVFFEGTTSEQNTASIVMLAYIEAIVYLPQFEFLIDSLINFIKENLVQKPSENEQNTQPSFSDQITKTLASMHGKEVNERLNILHQKLLISKGPISNITELAKVFINLKDEFSGEIAVRTFPIDLCFINALTGKSTCYCSSSIAIVRLNILILNKTTFIGYDKQTTLLLNANALKIIPPTAALYENLKKKNKMVFDYLTETKGINNKMVDSSFLMVSIDPEMSSSGEKEKKRLNLLNQITENEVVHNDALALANYQAKLNECIASINLYKKQIEQVSAQVIELSKLVQDKDNDNAKLLQEIERLTAKSNSLLNEKKESYDKLQALESEVQETKDKLSQLSIKNKELSLEISSYKILQIDSQSKFFKEQEEIKQKSQLEIGQLNQQIINLKELVSSYEEKAKSNKAIGQECEKSKSELENKLKQEEAKVKNLATLHQELQNKHKQLEQKDALMLNNLNQQKTEYELKIMTLNNQIEQNNQKKVEVMKLKANEDDAKLNVEKTKTEYSSKIKQMENKYNEELLSLQMQLIEKEQSLSNAIKEIKAQHESANAELTKQIFILETENAKINKKYDIKKSALITLHKQMGHVLCGICKNYKHTALLHCGHIFCIHCIKPIIGDPANAENRSLSTLNCTQCKVQLLMEDITTVKKEFSKYKNLVVI